jgi:hypothetical protein
MKKLDCIETIFYEMYNALAENTKSPDYSKMHDIKSTRKYELTRAEENHNIRSTLLQIKESIEPKYWHYIELFYGYTNRKYGKNESINFYADYFKIKITMMRTLAHHYQGTIVYAYQTIANIVGKSASSGKRYILTWQRELDIIRLGIINNDYESARIIEEILTRNAFLK